MQLMQHQLVLHRESFGPTIMWLVTEKFIYIETVYRSIERMFGLDIAGVYYYIREVYVGAAYVQLTCWIVLLKWCRFQCLFREDVGAD